MDVLFLATDAYGGTGGIALYNRDVAAAFDNQDRFAKIIVVPRVVATTLEPMPKKVRFDVSGLGGGLAYIRAVWRHVRTNDNIGLIYCGHVNLIPLAFLASKWLKVPWALCLYGIEAWTPSPRFFSRLWARNADLVLSVSSVTQTRFMAWCPIASEKCRVAPNAIHLEDFEMLSKDPVLLEKYGLTGRKVIMTLGRLDPTEQAKGFDRIIQILPELRKKVPDIAYLIVGKGGDKPRLESIAADAGVLDAIKFTGFVEERDKSKYYALADAYVMPSTGEGFGYVYIEAMACGIPVVGSSIDGSRDALREGMLGALVDPFDQQALISATLTALQQEKIIPDGLNYFNFSSFSERLDKYIENIIK